MKADDTGFLTIEGSLVPYADITDIDLSRWQRKSIARVNFRRRGRPATTDIDDWIYKGGDLVLAEVQRRTGIKAPPAGVPAAGPPPDPPGPAAVSQGGPRDSAS